MHHLIDRRVVYTITMREVIYFPLTPFSLDGRRQTVFSFSDLLLATRIFVVLWPLSRPTANSYLGAILRVEVRFFRLTHGQSSFNVNACESRLDTANCKSYKNARTNSSLGFLWSRTDCDDISRFEITLTFVTDVPRWEREAFFFSLLIRAHARGSKIDVDSKAEIL